MKNYSQIFQTGRGCKHLQGKRTSVPKKVVTISLSNLTLKCLRSFKTQVSSTVSLAIPSVKDISPIVNDVIQNDPPVTLHQVVNAVYDEIV